MDWIYGDLVIGWLAFLDIPGMHDSIIMIR
jgi:hypothetical protein